MLKKLHWFLFEYDLEGATGEIAPAPKRPFKQRVMGDLAWLVLFCYMMLVFNPILPVVADVLAHTFWEKEHLLTVHQENGKFHLHWDLIRAGKQSEKDKSSRSAKSDTEDYTHMPAVFTHTFLKQPYVKRTYPPHTFYCPVSYPDLDYRPPQAV